MQQHYTNTAEKQKQYNISNLILGGCHGKKADTSSTMAGKSISNMDNYFFGFAPRILLDAVGFCYGWASFGY